MLELVGSAHIDVPSPPLRVVAFMVREFARLVEEGEMNEPRSQTAGVVAWILEDGKTTQPPRPRESGLIAGYSSDDSSPRAPPRTPLRRERSCCRCALVRVLSACNSRATLI